MSDDPVMQMYEAQAIAVEQQMEINRLKRENEDLERKMRRLQLEKEASPVISKSKLDEVWTTVNELKKQIADVAELQGQSLAKLEGKIDCEKNNLCQKLENFQETLGSDVNKLKEQIQNIEKSIQKQDSENLVFRLKMEEIPQKIDRMETTVNKQTKRFHSVEWKVESISRQMKRETILIIGGARDGLSCKSMLVLSADRSEWIEIKLELPYEIFGSGVVYLNGEIYLIGGVNNPKALHKLDKNMKWIRLADMNEGRYGITNSCLEWNGCIWVFGGDDEKGEELKSVERYDPKENKWTQMPEMKTVRSSAATTLWNDKIIISGGWIAEKDITNTMECFNLEDGCWVEFSEMLTCNGGHSLVTFKNKLILMGGICKETYNTVWELDPQQPNSEWKPLPPMKYPSSHFAGIVLDNEIYAIGGEQGEDLPDLSRVEIFDGERWRDGPDLPYTSRGMSSVIIPQHFADRLCLYEP